MQLYVALGFFIVLWQSKIMKNKVKVIVAMSGGVDSSVAAALLKQAGFNVVGMMAKFWSDSLSNKKDSNKCCSTESEKMARLVAKKLEIPFYLVNLETEFKKKVVNYFLSEYKKGNTPNPCVVCNKEIKFGLLLEKAQKKGGDFLATGHYARYEKGKLLKGKDVKKDQSYFLWQLKQGQLKKVLFPVGKYTKYQVRALARKFDLPVAENSESQEVCFVSGTTNEFLKKYLKIKPGKIIDNNKKILGQHNGLWFYTVGQRKRLQIPQGPWYVIKKDFKKNILIVSKNEKDLLNKEVFVKNLNWIDFQNFPISADVKIRYKSASSKAKIFKLKGNKIKIVFQKSQKSITSGQSAVFYKKNELLGGGIIL